MQPEMDLLVFLEPTFKRCVTVHVHVCLLKNLKRITIYKCVETIYRKILREVEHVFEPTTKHGPVHMYSSHVTVQVCIGP